ncbi:MAG: hypothetical protein MUC43_15625 [Pirellula sp.]|jgi:hypothetical protein|nr:hypothetical protein [Pirellula sp.]
MFASLLRLLFLVPCYLWVAPWTCTGLLVGLICQTKGVEYAMHRGTLGIFGPGVARLLRKVPIAGGAKAMTLGHCILAVDRESWRETFSHEWIHVRQYQWFGPFFVPAYFMESAWQWFRGRDPYRDNRFERQAYKWE